MDCWLIATWEACNRQYFSGDLVGGEIAWGHVHGDDGLSAYDAPTNRITLDPNLIPDPDHPWRVGTVFGLTYTRDELLHAMVHQSCCQRSPSTDHDDRHRDELWMAEATRVAPLLELPPPTNSGYVARRELSRWPHSMRPLSDYDEVA